LLGQAVADALGLPYEGLSRRRAARLYGPPDRHRLLFGRGMVSDDTEHACLVAQSLIVSAGDVDSFERELARRMKWWLVGLPAGLGRATLLATLRLCCRVSPRRSGIHSAGNGPAMRAPLLGAAIPDVDRLRGLIRVSTRMTHTDPRADAGAFAIAWGARTAGRGTPPNYSGFIHELCALLADDGSELVHLLRSIEPSLRSGKSTGEFAAGIGLLQRVTGYINHTVPVALHAWLRHPFDFRQAVSEVIACGGDTDTTAAITGGLVGAAVGRGGIPQEWLDRLCEWPRSVSWMERLARQLARVLETGKAEVPLDVRFPFVLTRNLGFLAVVLTHGLRRLLPPY
jgi:ADP-ribosylglycohydrolase